MSGRADARRADAAREARRESERGAPSELAARGFARLACFWALLLSSPRGRVERETTSSEG